MSAPWFYQKFKVLVVAMLSVLTVGCMGPGGFGRVQYFPKREKPAYYLVMEHFPKNALKLDKLVAARIRVTIFLLPENREVFSEVFTVSSVGIIDFEAKMNERQEFSIEMKDRNSFRTWIAKIRKVTGQHGEVRYELIPPVAQQ